MKKMMLCAVSALSLVAAAETRAECQDSSNAMGGFYVGANFGYQAGQIGRFARNDRADAATTPIVNSSVSPRGVTGGVMAGYLWSPENRNLLWGVEGYVNLDNTNQKASKTLASGIKLNSELNRNWEFGLGLKGGFTFHKDMYAYATLDLKYSQFRQDYSEINAAGANIDSRKDTAQRFGLAPGFGIERRFNYNERAFTIGAEYTYSFFQQVKRRTPLHNGVVVEQNLSPKFHAVRVRVKVPLGKVS